MTMMKLGPPDDLMGKLGGPRPLIVFKRFNTAPLHFFNFWEILNVMQAEKEYMGP